MRTIGVVVNPIAGMGGRVGLKGTDEKVAEARERGATPRAPDRAVEALEALAEYGDEVSLLVPAGIMGEDAARAAGFDPTVVAEPSTDQLDGGDGGDEGDSGDRGDGGDGGDDSADGGDGGADGGGDGDDVTTAADTREAVRAMVRDGADLILFVGGDGTAADVAETLAEFEDAPPMLGVPAGVKVYSSVFAVRPRAAGHVAATFDRTERAEVNDVDEEQYRDGEVRTELRAVAAVPVAEQRQASKQLGGGSVDALAEALAEDVRDGVTYVFGPGSTVGAVEEALGVDGSPLGVDVWRDGEMLARDAGEAGILDALGEENVVVVSPIGGQGFLFGRGNQQISPVVIRRSDVEVIASRSKLDGVGVLRVDTGDDDLDEQLRGWRRVRVGPVERRLIEVV